MRLCNIFNAHFQGTSFVSIHPLRLDGLSWRMVCFYFSDGALRIVCLKRGQGFQKTSGELQPSPSFAAFQTGCDARGFR